MITLKTYGDWHKTYEFLKKNRSESIYRILEKYAKEGVEELRKNTPKDTGKTANSWGYKILSGDNDYVVEWTNSNIVDGVPIALVIQYGHGLPNGGYIRGVNYIGPSLQPIFVKMAERAWEEVKQ